MKVNNKVVVITGAASGIGAASAKLFAEHGAKVVLGDIDIKKVQYVSNEINEAGGTSIYVPVNVTSYETIENLITKAIDHFGGFDVMVNNAGIGPKTLTKTSIHPIEDWNQVIAVNQTGVFYGMRIALQHMEKQGHGNIVNIASLAGLKASGNNISYSASKFAVVGMTKSAALEYAKKNIRINAVCPGYTESPLLSQLLAAKPEMEAILKSVIPMKRFGITSEIAEAVVWLASDNSSYATGTTITLDGGTGL